MADQTINMDPRDSNALPPEVLLNIVSCLPGEHAFLLRQLSTYYNQLLNDHTINIRLRQEDTHDRCDSNTDSLRDQSAPETFDQEFTRRKALFRAHQTVPDILWKHTETMNGDAAGHLPQLKGKYLGWTDSETFFVLDLSNRILQTADLYFELNDFCMTDKLFATISNGTVTWRSITALPHEIDEIEVSGQTMAIAGDGEQLVVLSERNEEPQLFFVDTTLAMVTRRETLLPGFHQTYALHMAEVTTVLSVANVKPPSGRIGELTIDAAIYLTTVGIDTTITHVGNLPVKHGIGMARLYTTGDGRWQISLTCDAYCCLHNLRQERDGSWSEIPARLAATWKGKSYLRTEDGIKAGRYEILRSPELDECFTSRLLVNDSFLVDFIGGDNRVCDVYCFDKTATSGTLVPLEKMSKAEFEQSGKDIAYTQVL